MTKTWSESRGELNKMFQMLGILPFFFEAVKKMAVLFFFFRRGVFFSLCEALPTKKHGKLVACDQLENLIMRFFWTRKKNIITLKLTARP